ncbi:DAK2 domain-containing protein [Deinococcus peraridilitoris]|uniref:DAK2 domain fusion protein YloV n=1 Tax=Deinococcus peraridilitoris (strain DSM 19664 / LMG 22246 / CIP 109416 / KR-200) TaxID=937777 RepID=K9ZX72_DEIPD|nr:DAK2 domain-containing protein [Deinococcus peraridilitoris]AFZ65794.1 DAK2 domain fusion protein YloV [Deinococcus peraridilitoris DSM 19664]
MSNLTSAQIAASLRYATDWLGVYREQVNALNVYPVPDGDTGTNMHLTMQSVRRELDTCDENSMPSVARAISYGALLGARGNSGVILSQLLKGFAEAIRDLKDVSAAQLVHALNAAQKSGYSAVMKPVEGTILTVAREAAAGARGGSAREVLESALRAGHEALQKTPDQLPALKQAGVVDSGGQGYLYVLEGMLGSLLGTPLPAAPTVESYAGEQFETEEFGYCTEFLMSDATLPIEQIRELVTPFGDSLLVVGAEGYVKGHIHTNEPDDLLATVGRHGKMLRTKVEDMSEQHTEILAMAGAAARAEDEMPESGLVAVASGYGLTKLFRSLGARIVSGGQTQNPSVQDIVDAVRSVSARRVIILPNNKNILLAAGKAQEILGENALVVPTRTLGQGVGAALAFQAGVPAEELLTGMQEAASNVTTFEVTRASRSTRIGELDITQGDVIGLRDDELVHVGGSPEDAVVTMLQAAYDGQEILTVFPGPAVTPEALSALTSRLEETFVDLELEVHQGGPDLYDYLVTLE